MFNKVEMTGEYRQTNIGLTSVSHGDSHSVGCTLLQAPVAPAPVPEILFLLKLHKKINSIMKDLQNGQFGPFRGDDKLFASYTASLPITRDLS